MDLVATFLKSLTKGDSVVYRGQADISWPIIPSVGRPYWGLNPIADVPKRERLALDQFKRCAPRFLRYEPKSDIEWLAIMQHHGCPTRLLDFTTNPLVALFFASAPSPNGADGVLITADINPRSTDLTNDAIWHPENFSYFPTHATERITGQSSCFICCGKPTEPLSDEKLVIQRIPEDEKFQYRSELKTLGITYSLLFPGLDGVCSDLNTMIITGLESDSIISL